MEEVALSLDRKAAAQSIYTLAVSVRRVEARAQLSIGEARQAAARVIERVATELALREAELTRANEVLRGCLSQENSSCSLEYARVRRAEAAVLVARQCLASARQTQSDMNARLGHHNSRLAQTSTQARQFLSGRLKELGDYTALGAGVLGTGSGGSSHHRGTMAPAAPPASRGLGLTHPPGLPVGFAMVPLSLIHQSSSSVRGVQDFQKGYSPQDLAWAFQAFEQVVLPGLASGANADSFRARDQACGFQGTHSYSMTHSQFLSAGDSIRLNLQADGTYAIANGQHRVWVAQHYGIARVPARIV